MKLTAYKTSMTPVWCPGCGNYGIFNSLMMALYELGIDGSEVVNVAGIGCSGKMINHLTTYGVHALHGRALPIASGVALTNHNLTVVVNSGDGDTYGIGAGHFVHAARRNVNMLHLVHDNHIYGLTSGQASPTTDKGKYGKSTPHGVIDDPINPVAIALTSGATFVARGFVGESEQLKTLIKQGIEYEGYAYIDILQPCPTFAKDYNYQYYKENTYAISNDHDASDFRQALDVAYGEKIGLGVLYNVPRAPHHESIPQLKSGALIDKEVSVRNISEMMNSFK